MNKLSNPRSVIQDEITQEETSGKRTCKEDH